MGRRRSCCEPEDTLQDRVVACALAYGLFPHGEDGRTCPVVLMVSGGGDSVALLHLIGELRGRLGIGAVRVMHVDHMLRGSQSDADRSLVERLCAAEGVECSVHRVDIGALVRETGDNMEALARTVRYEAAAGELDALCDREGVPHDAGRIVVAHTADDRIETFYMRTIVGGGLGSLVGMGYVSGRVVRPLLTTTREELRDYLVQRAVARGEMAPGDDPVAAEVWREDATNADTEHFRSYVRHEVVPLLKASNPRLETTLGRTLDHLTDEDRLLDRLARDRAEGLVEHLPDGTVVLDLEGLAGVELPLRRRIVRATVLELLPDGTRLDGFHIDSIVDGAARVGFVTVLPTGLIARNEYGRLAFHRRGSDEDGRDLPGAWLDVPGSLTLEDGRMLHARFARDLSGVATANPSEAYVDIGTDRRLWVRHPLPGERMCPLGMGGHGRKVSDILVDGKVPARLRSHVAVVVRGNGDDDPVVWLVGLRVDERSRVRPDRALVGGIVHLIVEDPHDVPAPCGV